MAVLTTLGHCLTCRQQPLLFYLFWHTYIHLHRCSGTSSCTWTGSILIVAASSAAKPIPPRIKFVRPGTTAQVLSPDSLSKAKLLYSYTAGTGGQQRSIGFWRFTLRAKLDGRAAKRIKYSVLLPPG